MMLIVNNDWPEAGQNEIGQGSLTHRENAGREGRSQGSRGRRQSVAQETRHARGQVKPRAKRQYID